MARLVTEYRIAGCGVHSDKGIVSILRSPINPGIVSGLILLASLSWGAQDPLQGSASLPPHLYPPNPFLPPGSAHAPASSLTRPHPFCPGEMPVCMTLPMRPQLIACLHDSAHMHAIQHLHAWPRPCACCPVSAYVTQCTRSPVTMRLAQLHDSMSKLYSSSCQLAEEAQHRRAMRQYRHWIDEIERWEGWRRGRREGDARDWGGKGEKSGIRWEGEMSGRQGPRAVSFAFQLLCQGVCALQHTHSCKLTGKVTKRLRGQACLAMRAYDLFAGRARWRQWRGIPRKTRTRSTRWHAQTADAPIPTIGRVHRWG